MHLTASLRFVEHSKYVLPFTNELLEPSIPPWILFSLHFGVSFDGSLLRGDFDSSDPLSDLPSPTAARNWFLLKREAIGAESLEDSAFAFVPSRWIVVRPKTSSSLEARLHIA
jgi:hypothetical protein